jgi:O-methyltransferase
VTLPRVLRLVALAILRFTPGDLFTGDLPRADVLVMGLILHDWDLPTKGVLISKAHAALDEGGPLIIYEFLIDDARRTHLSGLLMSLNMLDRDQGRRGSAFGSHDSSAIQDATTSEGHKKGGGGGGQRFGVNLRREVERVGSVGKRSNRGRITGRVGRCDQLPRASADSRRIRQSRLRRGKTLRGWMAGKPSCRAALHA